MPLSLAELEEARVAICETVMSAGANCTSSQSLMDDMTEANHQYLIDMETTAPAQSLDEVLAPLNREERIVCKRVVNSIYAGDGV